MSTIDKMEQLRRDLHLKKTHKLNEVSDAQKKSKKRKKAAIDLSEILGDQFAIESKRSKKE